MVQELQAGDPHRIGSYQLIGRLGTGGMGRVFLGRSKGGRLVAVKVIRDELAGDPEFRVRFGREVAAARMVSGLFTAPVVDAGLDAPMPWLATAYVAGPSLADTVRVHGPLPAASVLALAAGLAEGLCAIHAAGVVHRDLKPSNVLLADDGPRVIDFGISRAAEASALTHSGLVVGSPGFMSPEQAEGREVGPASDVFSLGAVLVFAATGEGPFGAGSTAALVYRVVYSPPGLDQVPAQVRPLIERCLAKEASKRPAANELLEELGGADFASDWLPAPVIQGFPQHPLPDPAVADAALPMDSAAEAPTEHPATLLGPEAPLGPATVTAATLGRRPEQVSGQPHQGSPGPSAPARISALTGLVDLDTMAFSPDGRTLATLTSGKHGSDHKVILWDVADLSRPVRAATLADQSGLYAMAISPNGRALATAAKPIGSNQRELILWDVADPARPSRISTFSISNYVNTIALSPDGRTLATGSSYEVTLWDLTTRTRLWKSRPTSISVISSSAQGALAFSPDGRTLATADYAEAGNVTLWDVTDLAKPGRISTLTGPFELVHGVQFSPDGRILAIADRRRVTLWGIADLAFPSPLIATLIGDDNKEQGDDNKELAVTFSPDARILATAEAGDVTLWDITDLARPGRLAVLTGLAPTRTVAFSPDGRTLATTGGVRGSVILWNIGEV